MKREDDFEIQEGMEYDPVLHELSIMKQLIQERSHPLALLRELISNAGAREVGAKNIKISYYIHEEWGRVFEVSDDGCGMDFTNDPLHPGRLDRFLGLGLSKIVGYEGDEFSWKGLGSKFAFQSRRLVIETWTGSGKVWQAMLNEPWETIEEGRKPKSKITSWDPEKDRKRGTRIQVFGHPPHKRDNPFPMEEIRDYLLHRTFVGFTRQREEPPTIKLAVFGQQIDLQFGFPELKRIQEDEPEGTVFIKNMETVKNIPGKNEGVKVTLKGFYTLDDKLFGLGKIHYNTGLILSVQGIPYFTLDLQELGSRQLVVVPGANKCCLIAECDDIQKEMNISRSGLVDSELTDALKSALGKLIGDIESSQRHRDFRRVPEERKHVKSARKIGEKKRSLESMDQPWVYIDNGRGGWLRLVREPESEGDTLAILWKLEALGRLPFTHFETLGHGTSGADLIVHFQEDDRSDPERYTTVEVERVFSNYRLHRHLPSQMPTVICWDISPTPKIRIEPSNKPYKYTARIKDYLLRIFVLKRIEGIKIAPADAMSKEEER